MPAPSPRRLALVVSLTAAALIIAALPAWPMAGGLDPSFDGDGVAVTAVGGFSHGSDVIVQEDGKIVVAGAAQIDGSTWPILVRYSEDGSLDTSFASSGVAVAEFEGLTGGYFEAVAAGPAGTLVATGSACVPSCAPFMVARFTSAGDPDLSFGDDGVVVDPALPGMADILVRDDGRIVTLGSSVVALEVDGDPDPAFGGGDGVVTSPRVGASWLDLALDAQGRPLLAGYFQVGGHRDLVVSRLEVDGDLDTTFSQGGTEGSGLFQTDLAPMTGAADPAATASSVAVDASGRIVVGGATSQPADIGSQPFLLRLTGQGEFDPTFSGDGVALKDRPGLTEGIGALAIQPDGAITFSGGANVDGSSQVMAGRFLANGSADLSFGGGGIVSYDVQGEAGPGLALQEDGGIVIPAKVNDPGVGQLHIGAVRFVGDDPCTLNGTSGPDTLTGTSGPDVLCGLGGNDVFLGKGGNDVLIGGPGLDTASYAGAGTVITANLATGTATGQGTDTLDGIERLTGGLKADKLTGDAVANTLTGGAGADTLNGGGGADSLLGGDGNDILNGGAGNDSLNGGPGTDDCNQGTGTGPKTSCET